MDNLQIITTEDGSHSLLHASLNETYHSVHGAVQESRHVFLQHGWEFLVATRNPTSVSILEIGFGTGLNALLTLQASADSPAVRYVTLEAYPLPDATWRQLNYSERLKTDSGLFTRLHEAPWGEDVMLQEGFTLRKVNTPLQQWVPTEKFNLVYFDAFAPSRQPEMWELPQLEKIVQAMQPEAVFVTYCAKGQLKRDLKSLGLLVETLPGSPGKKEMVRATRP